MSDTLTAERLRGKWRAAITVNREQTHLGTFDSPEKAHDVYVAAKRKALLT